MNSSFLPVFFRSLGALLFLPLGDGALAGIRKVFFAAGLALLITGRFQSSKIPLETFSFLFDLGIGAALGFPAVLAVRCAEMLGELFDAGRGQSIAAMYDPTFNSTSSIMALLCGRYAWVVFLLSGGFEHLIVAIQKSIILNPPGLVSSFEIIRNGHQMLCIAAGGLSHTFALYLLLAVVFIVIDIAAGFFAKITSIRMIQGELFQLKTCLGVIVLIYFERVGLLNIFIAV